ncbi:MAG: serine protease [Pseudomonadota bacterium]
MNSSLRPYVFALLLLVLGLVPVLAFADELTTEQIDQISRTVVRIVAEQNGQAVATGSGTLISADGRIFTNRHVIEGANDYVIEVLGDLNELPVPTYRASLSGYSMDLDFAVIQIDRSADGEALDAGELSLPFLPNQDQLASRGDSIFVFGYPGISEGYLAFTEGTVTTIRNGTMNDERVPVWFQTDAQISPGNSGGLVVNEDGEMVGIPTSVISEGETGGRLGGILPVTAVRAAVAQGLEDDVSQMGLATSAPVLEGGRLDYAQDPAFGAAELNAGFSPDPFGAEMVSGGEVAVGYLGGECRGYAAVAPDFRLNWTGSSSELRFFFSASDGGDTTLLVNQPDGSWVCNDDSPNSLDPLVVLANPAEGQYDIWVGSYEAGAYVPGNLYVTELELEPDAMQPTELDLSLEPFYGSLNLEAGSNPDPRAIEMAAGGSTDVSYLGEGCIGFAAVAPDIRMQWAGAASELIFAFSADEGGDTSLIVNVPDGSWVCDDDSGGNLDPMVVLSNPMSGQYDIWVGTYQSGPTLPGRLIISEQQKR